ncbi:small ribosomal subunit protein bS21c isoform X1 [Coffea arabica]|uniref:Small ribosomal subunit protein bS21c isoform X1 n=1 Tax=Coffea arabica TaxID=13443 RepID=A0A6P6VG24_COFAR|nr:30S ribosomal protein S21, chloroplastic [Coffea arabica]
MAAAASSIANLLSFFAPSSKPPALLKLPQPSHLFIPTCSTKDGLALAAATRLENQQYLPLSSSTDNDLNNGLMSVVCPSLAYANTLFFRSAYNVQVLVDENEPEEKLLNRFRREVMRAGVIQECRRRRFFENKQDEKKRKSREAAKRNRRRRPQSRGSFQDRQETSKNSKQDEDEDNWELPDGDLPY